MAAYALFEVVEVAGHGHDEGDDARTVPMNPISTAFLERLETKFVFVASWRRSGEPGDIPLMNMIEMRTSSWRRSVVVGGGAPRPAASDAMVAARAQVDGAVLRGGGALS